MDSGVQSTEIFLPDYAIFAASYSIVTSIEYSTTEFAAAFEAVFSSVIQYNIVPDIHITVHRCVFFQ